MGAALALNMAEKGFAVAVHNRSAERTQAFIRDAGPLADHLTPTEDLAGLAAALDRPRAIIAMVPAGDPVDAVIAGLLPHLDPGDLIIDAGNANFHDTRRREAALREKGFNFIGMGVSGGEDGARHGPSIMVGGPEASYAPIRDVIEAIAARYQDDPCAAHLGPDGAGHFVKTVHNGIEYADMQLIAEVWGMLRDGQGRTPASAAALCRRVATPCDMLTTPRASGTSSAASPSPLKSALTRSATALAWSRSASGSSSTNSSPP